MVLEIFTFHENTKLIHIFLQLRRLSKVYKKLFKNYKIRNVHNIVGKQSYRGDFPLCLP